MLWETAHFHSGQPVNRNSFAGLLGRLSSPSQNLERFPFKRALHRGPAPHLLGQCQPPQPQEPQEPNSKGYSIQTTLQATSH
eukprot:355426-Chlamydomonas_euryale.AAC.1